jgi:transcriptional regulator with XRE-family HTH domain
MAHINPEALKSLRKKKRRWTLDQLAEEAGVDKQTIHRLERGKGRQPRGTTLEKLAKALGVAAEALTGPIPDETESTPPWEPNKSQLNLRISDQARNALLLVCERYHVRPAQVVELAPLLFNWAAEKCLRQRQERIDILQQRESEISEGIERFYTDVGNLTGDHGPPPEIELPDLSQFWINQDCGLSYRYLFDNSEPGYEEFGYSAPIVDFLDELASEIGDGAEFARWQTDSSPTYSICKEEATWLAGGDEVALENILQGYAPLNELPKEFWEQLRNRNTVSFGTKSNELDKIRQHQAAERVEWLCAHSRQDEPPEAVP